MRCKKLYPLLVFSLLVTAIYVLWSISPSVKSSSDLLLLSSTGSGDTLVQEAIGTSTLPEIHAPAFNPNDKWAYVFLAPNEAYLCYALVNIDRLFSSLNIRTNIDVVLMVNSRSGDQKVCTQDCFPQGRLKLAIMEGSDPEAFVSFRAFAMTEYSRVISIESDGIIMRNLDHLFELDLQGYDIATTTAQYNASKLLTSMIMVIKPSEEVFQRISNYSQVEKVEELLSELENKHDSSALYGSDGDMLLNHLTSVKLLTAKRLPQDYATLETEALRRTKASETSNAYYIAFENRPLEPPNKGQTMDDSALEAVIAGAAGDEARANYLNVFWQGYYRRCEGLLET